MIKSLSKRKLLISSIISLIVVGLLSIVPFSSPCACIPADAMFAMYLNIKSPKDLSPSTVAAGFRELFPKDAVLNPMKLPRFMEEDVYCKLGSQNMICDYWIESNPVAKKGYRVTLFFDKEGRTTHIKVNRVNSWFGIKSVDGHIGV